MEQQQLLANAVDQVIKQLKRGGKDVRRCQLFELVEAKTGMFLCDTKTENSKLGRRLSIALGKLVEAGVLNQRKEGEAQSSSVFYSLAEVK